MLPPAPGRLSTMTCCPRRSSRRGTRHADHRVGAAARREGHDHADRLVGKAAALRLGRRVDEPGDRQQGGGTSRQHVHLRSSNAVRVSIGAKYPSRREPSLRVAARCRRPARALPICWRRPARIRRAFADIVEEPTGRATRHEKALVTCSRRHAAEELPMNTADLIAIDIHTHLEVSCRNPFDNYGEEYDRAADKYFRSSKRPTMDETIAFYREKKIGFVNFTVDAETHMGRRRIPNEEIADAAQANSDIMIAFGSIDPHKGKDGRARSEKAHRGARRQGLQVPPDGARLPARRQDGLADLRSDRRAQAARHLPQRPLGHRLGHALRRRPAPAELEPRCCSRTWRSRFRTSRSSSPIRAGRGRTKRSRWRCTSPTSGSTSRAGARKYFPPQLVQYANTLLKDRILFGSDFPLITPDRWLKDFAEAGFKDEVRR